MQDLDGAVHSLPISIAQSNYGGAGNCSQVQGAPFPQNVLSGADDFFQAVTTGVCPSCIPYVPNPVTVAGPDGSVYQFSNFSAQVNGVTAFWAAASSVEDRNGNIASLAANRGSNGVMSLNVVDTFGRSAVNVTALSSNSNAITVAGVNGTYAQTWESVPISLTITSTPVGNSPCTGIGVGNYQSSNYVISSITLPNTTQSYQFEYDPIYGTLSKITYPDGGYVSYVWGLNKQSEVIQIPAPPNFAIGSVCYARYDYPAIVARSVSYDGVHVAEEQSFHYITNWTSPTSTGWTTKQTTVTTTDAIRSTSYKTTYTYSATSMTPLPPNVPIGLQAAMPMEQSVLTATSGGATLKTVYKTWLDPFLLKCELDELNNNTNFMSATWYAYGAGGLVTDKKQYDYGMVTSTTACSGTAPSSPTREVSTLFQSFPSTKTFPSAPSIFNRPGSVQTSGAGVLEAETDYAYDGTTVTTASATSHDETNYGVSNGNRANVTTKTIKCLGSGCSNAVTTYTYDETGNITSMTDPCGNGSCSDMVVSGHTTTYSYVDSFSTGSNTCTSAPGPSGNTNGLLTKIVDPLTHSECFSYDYSSSQLTGSKDQNKQLTTYAYADPFSRPTLASYPDGGQTTIAYTDVAPSPNVTTCKLISGSTNQCTTLVMDGLGHAVQTQLTDPETTDFVDISYDGMGRVYTQSNPHRSSASSTDGTTTYIYDELGRATSVTRPDGSDVDTTYAGNCTVVADEVGAVRRSCYDLFGRVTEVDEPGIGAQSETPGSGTITIGGSEQTATVNATPGKGSVTVYGTEQSTIYFPCGVSSCPTTLWDQGSVSITINGFTAYGSYGQGSTASSVASGLVSYFNSNGSSPVSATLNGAVVALTAKTTGASTNYQMSATSTTNYPSYFSSPSFSGSLSGSTLTGGQNAGTAYDSGTVSITINSLKSSASYGNGSTSSSIASALAAALNSGSSVTASANGSTISITATDAGSNSNYPVSASVAWNTEDFSQASFSASVPNTLTGGSDGTVGTGPLVTLYTYDALNNLTCAVQKGSDTTAFTSCAASPATWRPRSFVYDSLSRLTSATNPESGTILYTYDANGNVSTKTAPAPNHSGGTVQTSYFYDALNRLTKKSYSDGSTPTIQYGYDAVALAGCTIAPPSLTDPYPVGTRTAMCDSSGATSWSHDKMGRPATLDRNVGGFTRSATYVYNLDGSLSLETTFSGKQLQYTYGSAGRVLSLTDPSASPAYNFVTNATYTPNGALAGAVYAAGSTGFNGFTETDLYNSRLQPTVRFATSSAGTAISLCYDFHLRTAVSITSPVTCSFGAGSGDNGNVFQITNNRDTTRSQSFTYDALNRITSGASTGSWWGTNYAIDAWGNLTNASGISGKTNSQNLQAAPANNNNQLNGFCHDAAGNLVFNSSCPTPPWSSTTYVYDAENRLKTAGGAVYVYDGDGNRVEKLIGGTGTLYWRESNGDLTNETDINNVTLHRHVYFDGRRLARTDTQPTYSQHFYFSDHLGSANVVANGANGTIEEDSDYYPYGGELVFTNNVPQNYKFTGKERDSETGLDMFGARYYGNSLGRFMTPDWAEKPIDVPYADFGNPQSLNLYSYVKNNPTTTRDPDGHCAEDACVIEGTAAIGAAVYVGGAALVAGTAAVLSTPSGQRSLSTFTSAASQSISDSISGIKSFFSKSESKPAPPNPNGSKGAPDHQATADEEAAKIGGEREVRVQTPGGEKGSRVIDAARTDANGKVVEATQVIRPNKDGTPPAREVRAASDIQKATGVQPKLVPVRPIKPDGQ